MGKESIHARKAAIEATAPVVGNVLTHARIYEKSDIAWIITEALHRLYTRHYVNHVRI